MMKNKYELLAPAGNMSSLEAAVIAGADAVYLGASEFSARAKAKNFNIEELMEAITYAHLRNVKIFVTMNILIADTEFEEALKLAQKLYDIGVDALIVQDFGLVKEIKKLLPDFELHASTQMAINNYYGALFLKDMGFSRIVLARETPIFEIKKIKELNIDIEVFIHGALCVCYSGECLMSSMIGGKSGNRGECAQACRKQYEIFDLDKNSVSDSKYYLSPKDLNTLDEVKQLLAAGAFSLKIEGRMKSPQYVYQVVSAYKNAISGKLDTTDKQNVEQAFNRGFTKGLFNGDFGRNFVSYDRPDNRGIEIGKVMSVRKNKAKVVFSDTVFAGDGLEFKNGGKTFGIKTDKKYLKGKEYILDLPEFTEKESIINRTFSIKWKENIDSKLETDEYKIPIDMKVIAKVGQKPIIYGKTSFVKDYYQLDEIIEAAHKSPITEDKITENLSKLNDTIFYLNSLKLDLDKDAFMRISSVNALRRGIIGKIERQILNKKVVRKKKNNLLVETDKILLKNHTKIKVFFNKFEHLEKVDFNKIDEIIIRPNHVNKFKSRYPQLKFSVYLDKFYSYIELEKVRNYILEHREIEGIWINNISQYYIFKNDDIKINGDIGLNVFNKSSLDFLSKLGLYSVTLSPELNAKQIKVLSTVNSNTNIVSYGRLPVMTMKHCPFSIIKNCKDERYCPECKFKNYYLRDTKNVDFEVLRQDAFTEIFNSYPILLDGYVKTVINSGLNLLILGDEYTNDVINLYREFNSDKYEKLRIKLINKYGQVTKGHINRGIIGD